MQQYLENLQYILDNGTIKTDRTGTGTISVFGLQTRYNLSTGFPAVTTKKLAFKAVVSELLWFLEGSTNERRLAEIHYGSKDAALGKKTIWTENAEAPYWKDKAQFDGDLGRVYGAQWRDWTCLTVPGKRQSIDQILTLINGLRDNPDSRRHVVIGYNPGEIDQMALPPCHSMFQMYVDHGKLSCMMTQRSADFFLGVPFNIASYALLTHIIAQIVGLDVGDFIHSIGDAHIYLNHINQVKEQLSRKPKTLPTLWINPDITSLDNFTMQDFELHEYTPWPAIKAAMAV